MPSPLLLLLLCCACIVGCSRTPRPDSLDRKNTYQSIEGDQPLHSLEIGQLLDSLMTRPPLSSRPHPDNLQTQNTRSPKSVGDKDCLPTDGTAYTGKANTTVGGLSCQMWSVLTPHNHSNTDVGDHNYCRGLGGGPPMCYTTDPGTRWDYCLVPDCVAPPQSEEEIGCKVQFGTDYTGKANITVSGRVCQKWTVNSPHPSYHQTVGEHNYCRNPDDDDFGPWCYTLDPQIGWEHCEIPECVTQPVDKIDCRPMDGSDYTGVKSTTRSGRTCKKWSDISVFAHLGDHNHCRDPVNMNALICFTTDVKMLWDYCDVPVCVPRTKGI